MEEKDTEGKKNKQLFAITTDNIWKITTVILAIILLAFVARNFIGDETVTSDSSVTDDQTADIKDTKADIKNLVADKDIGSEPDNTNGVIFSINENDRIMGDEDAQVVIIEYSDFQCPYCQKFYKETEGKIVENYVKTGKVMFIYRHFPLSIHVNAQIAAEAAECAGDQGAFWEMHNKMFESGSGDGSGLARIDLESYAAELGFNLDGFSSCLDSRKYKDKIENDMALGTSQGVRGTPAFLINGGLLSGAQPYNAFETAINAALNT